MRLVDAPIGLPYGRFEELGGPNLIGQVQTETMHVQNVSNPFGLWSFQVDYPPIQGPMARAFGRWRTSLLGGANCTRLHFCSHSEPTYAELGIDISTYQDMLQPWEGGITWDDGGYWLTGKPAVPVTASAAKGGSVITLDLSDWNGVVPEWFGIVGHFAVYKVIGDDVVGDTARLKVWPPIRKAITASDYATLRPVICVTLVNQNSASGAAEVDAYRGASLVVREVLQETVDGYVTEGF